MDIRLDYGKQGLNVTLPDDLDVRVLTYKPAIPIADQSNQSEQAALREVLNNPTNFVFYILLMK